MPKSRRNTKPNEFLRFRPYQAFTATPSSLARQADRNKLWRIIWFVLVVALLCVFAIVAALRS